MQVAGQARALGGDGAAFHLLAQAGVLDGERRLVAERLGDAHFLFAERPGLVEVEGDDAEEVRRDGDGDGDARAVVADPVRGRAGALVVAAPRDPEIGRRDRPALADHRPGRVLPDVQGHPGHGLELDSGRGLRPQQIAAGIVAEEHAGVAHQQLACLRDDVVEQLRQRPVRAQHGDLLESLELRGERLQPGRGRPLRLVELIETTVEVAERDEPDAGQRAERDQQDVLAVGPPLDHHGEDGQSQAQRPDKGDDDPLVERQRDEQERDEVEAGDGVAGDAQIEDEGRRDAGEDDDQHVRTDAGAATPRPAPPTRTGVLRRSCLR